MSLSSPTEPRAETQVDSRVDRAAAYSWRLLVIAAVVFATFWLLGQLLVVVIPIAVALLLTRALSGPANWLTDRGLPRGVAAGAILLLFLATLALLLGAVGASIATEFDELGPTLSEGIDDVQDWLVDDSPFDVDRERLADLREQASARLSDLAESSGGTIASSAVLAVEFIAGLLLALIVTFFFLKDDDVIVQRGLRTVREDRRDELHALGRRAWATLGGYLRGVAFLGVLEAAIIGVTVWLAGGGLVGAVVVVTLLGAFVPIAGAILAGVVAVMVTLVTAGPTAAAVVAVVAVVVQQLDNDLLAPFIYGKSLQLHPLVILLSIAAGTALFGVVGALLAVPVVSVALNMFDESRNPELERDRSEAEA